MTFPQELTMDHDPLVDPDLDLQIFAEDIPKKGGGGRKRKKDTGTGFRKAPQAPKRFKSPYILFSMAKMEELKKEGGGEKVTSVSKRIAEAWKTLSVEERKKWDEVAKQDKLRYNAEKSLYTGPWQVPSKRTRKDPSAPKRPMSAFLFFSQGMRQVLKKQHPEMKNTEISCLLGARWKNATEEERRPHIEREQREREQYKKDIAEWRDKKEQEEKANRKRRQEIAEQFVKSGYFQPGYVPPAFDALQHSQQQQQQQQAMAMPYHMIPITVPPPAPAAPMAVPPASPAPVTFQQQQPQLQQAQAPQHLSLPPIPAPPTATFPPPPPAQFTEIPACQPLPDAPAVAEHTLPEPAHVPEPFVIDPSTDQQDFPKIQYMPVPTFTQGPDLAVSQTGDPPPF